MLYLALCPCSAGALEVTEQNVRAAILGTETFTVQEQAQLDVNDDGRVDVGDLAIVAGVPVASFEIYALDVTEGDGTIQVDVTFTSAFTGTLHYTVDGTAVSGDDYTPLSGTVAVTDADATTIDIPLVDDAVREDVAETVILTIDHDPDQDWGYVPGASMIHQVSIADNDAVWKGSIRNNNAVLHFEMELTRTAGGTTAMLRGDSDGIIPPHAGEDGWPAAFCLLTETQFEAVVSDMEIPIELTLAGTSLRRRLWFTADAGNEDHVVDAASEIRGTVAEVIESTEEQHLDTALAGSFAMIKSIPEVDPSEPELEPVEE